VTFTLFTNVDNYGGGSNFAITLGRGTGPITDGPTGAFYPYTNLASLIQGNEVVLQNPNTNIVTEFPIVFNASYSSPEYYYPFNYFFINFSFVDTPGSEVGNTLYYAIRIKSEFTTSFGQIYFNAINI
jgi:hypothetical protein